MTEPRRCQALNKRGEPCGATPLRDQDWCSVHDPSCPVAARFAAGPDHTISPGKPPLPTSTELRVARWNALVADEWDRIETIYKAGLRAKQTATFRGEVFTSDVDDLGFQADIAERLVERLDGKPRQSVETTGRLDVKHEVDVSGLSVEELQQLHDLLERARAATKNEEEAA